MNPEVAALKIQGFFIAYRHKKKQVLHEAISISPAVQLLQALDLRFQCMRAVAVAKLPIRKPIEDKTQVVRVIKHAEELAKEKGLTNLDAIAKLFSQNVTLSENIQSPYYDLILTKCNEGERDLRSLVNNAYYQLNNLIVKYGLNIVPNLEKSTFTPEDVLGLAREIIQFAGRKIIEALANPDLCDYYEDAQEDIGRLVEQMLSNYMTPSALSKSIKSMYLLVESFKDCSCRI